MDVKTLIDETTTAKFVQTFKVLSDATRFELLNLLLTHDLCVGALARRLGISEAAVSQHLKQLREAGLVKGEKRGYWTHYAVERDRLNRVAEALTGLTVLPRCPEGACTNRPGKKNDCRKEGIKMCDYNCSCQYPERLKGTPEECTPEQIRECHGGEEHPCGEEEGVKE
ncbi:MAG: HTH-type transcriptional repressor AseR [Syntrophorhabdaceae bacterium PtaU1.Bin034]|jgi:DNA-binding transcriptional ArsR family regulator|nr:MAG: HTH-type transcriptional repressor AseR [Syntrophorhabdaceae bacterium PtaU1.Bin034]